jgi:DUF4097 and DUF4098 domain-containing protein YvlB
LEPDLDQNSEIEIQKWGRSAMKRFLLIFALLAVVVAPVFAADGSFQRTFQVNGPVDLDVSTRSGDITVHTGSSSTVVINARIRTNMSSWFGGGGSESDVRQIEQNPPVSQSGNNIRIDNIPDSDRGISVSYDITTPPQTKLHARSGSGTLKASSLRGTLEGKTGSGDIRLDNIDGDVNASTGSGSIELDHINGGAQVHTGSGSIRLHSGGQGNVQASTGSGSITVEGVSGAVEAKTGSGNIDVGGTQKGDWRFSTGSGSIRLHVASNAAFDLDAHTGSGRVYVQHPITMQGEVGNAKTVMGKVNGGGPLMHVRSGSGNITIE